MQTVARLSTPLSRAGGLVVFAASAVLAGQASAAVLVSDDFSDNDRSNQSLPNSLQWFGASGAPALDASGGNLVLPLVAKSGAIAFFTASESPLVMGVGDELSLSFTITTPATGAQTGDNSFLFGFLSSGATRTANDTTAFNNGIYSNDTGYFAVAPLAGAHALRNKLVERAPGANNLTTSTNFVQLGDGSPTPNLSAGGTYTYSLSMTLVSANEMSLTSDMGGVVLNRTDATPLSSFDSVFIYTGSNPAVVVDNVVVEHVAGIPEPAALGLLALSAGGIVLRRRHA